MTIRILLIYVIQASFIYGLPSMIGIRDSNCVTGYMTDLQSWVTNDGKLTTHINISEAIDVAYQMNVASAIVDRLDTRTRTQTKVRYLSLARCNLKEIPPIFSLTSAIQLGLSESVEYVTFYGNNFAKLRRTGYYESFINATDAKEVTSDHETGPGTLGSAIWSSGLSNVTLRNLRHLDLRACQIDTLEDNTFQGMPSLTHLFLGENQITYIHGHAFVGLNSILHIDLSKNSHINADASESLKFESLDTFASLNLTSLDFSHTLLSPRHLPLLTKLGQKVERLSICHTAIFPLRPDTFYNTSLQILDLSGNHEILSQGNVLRGLENSLQVLYAKSTFLSNLAFIKNFKKLEILKVSYNEIIYVPSDVLHTLDNLQVLDLTGNRISSWFEPIISRIPQLKLLSLAENNINVVSELMINDMKKVRYLALSKNSMICYCSYREMYEIAFKNELTLNQTILRHTNVQENFHKGYGEYNDMIRRRINLTLPCFAIKKPELQSDCLSGFATNATGNYLFLDYDELGYSCISMTNANVIPLHSVATCSGTHRGIQNDLMDAKKNNLWLLTIFIVMIPILGFTYIYRRNLKYFLITMRNSAMLSLINPKNVVDVDSKIFNYDVFVSYCNEDRAWVLDHLLPHVETDCNISVCLHERDFQVGLSILENIVSCMDRSRSIMLIISKRFLLSQWCQFEMHLAQHRLLETRREDLILILLENIPRRLRPNTLHYLMLTKTYVVWPKDVADRKEFWKRMKRSLVTQKLKSIENHSLA